MSVSVYVFAGDELHIVPSESTSTCVNMFVCKDIDIRVCVCARARALVCVCLLCVCVCTLDIPVLARSFISCSWCCNVLQFVAVWCSLLQFVAAWCSLLQFVAACRRVLISCPPCVPINK